MVVLAKSSGGQAPSNVLPEHPPWGIHLPGASSVKTAAEVPAIKEVMAQSMGMSAC